MKIIIIGYGTVGQALTKILYEKEKQLFNKYGLRSNIVAVVDRGGAIISKTRLKYSTLMKAKASGTVASDPNFGKPGLKALQVIEEEAADVVIELTPTNIIDGEPGMSNIKSALTNKKNVITTNKGPLVLALITLIELARHNGVHLRFSGAVGGGLPVLNFAKKSLIGDRIISIKGILNGTTNYILTRMAEAHISLETALKEAQLAGYAEADPSYDLNGVDTACKLAIMSNWILDKNVKLKDINVSGILDVTLSNIKKIEKKGQTIKLVGSIDDEKIVVKPQTLSKNNPICVDGVLNAVAFNMESAGEITLVGGGAGGVVTSSAILRDLIEIRRYTNS
ncbi:MAG: homoserine dehydrogenase [Candidatus Bathyarchaeota archaeon]|nr:MAG: homoserine dehydrogenase [Candidatus Bathyarchaeota archaeon]